ncbi:Outer membrane protein assembly factor BamB, contains PQQ-like beta-propeller repeat [Asanoa ishikariensis]|uniref:Outer membrane protein assembly factor BamB, contains PQQ-like beta-propeller repeat n=1 Tax=Asanoa ishikariensis TaxID=137265 RepID=A0A1H3U9I7_9ACTN|nr:S8 family serine peptidase [Asanoa ishikariensis]SDZ58751.1 Outer membrane protein assembly factor BamB, contains PQQ-like beta-propeller repeat [Asanoa ishikariensis]
MSTFSRARRWLPAGVAVALAVQVAVSGTPAMAAPDSGKQTYIVQMALDPVVAYGGGVAGMAPTRPGHGRKVNPRSSDVTRYAAHVRGQQDRAVRTVGAKKRGAYVYSFDGFSADLTKAQAAKLRALPDVVAVTADRKVTTQTSSTAGFLGLDQPGGLWDQLRGPEDAGEGLVIGVIDSGIWPDSASFANPDAGGKAYAPLTDFHGTCETGTDDSWHADDCTGKIVAARHFNNAWGGDAGIKTELPWEFPSPRDYNGHGTHTASTAGGNHGVQATGPMSALGKITGMAPRARIASYKALWSAQDGSTASGATSDIVAAIDQSVADGVDVLNFSVSGTTSDLLDPMEVAFLAAAKAGVFVSASAGNSGPAATTVAHPSPWVTTVAADTHNRTTTATATLGDAAAYTGASLAGTSAGPAPLVYASAATIGLPKASDFLTKLCYAAVDNGGKPVLDPAKVAGKIVVCERGNNPRVNKSLAVKQAGGVGMILVNTDPADDGIVADVHSVPSVHLPAANLVALRAYAAQSGATATISAATISYDAPAPYIAEFSSRGPSTAAGGDLLKPDLAAPGQDILAAVAPPGQGGLDFNLMSGTSMSAPHVAGLAALLKQRHPDWSPMAVKSALMTTSRDLLDAPGVFAQGAGHVVPNSAVDPGLVYDSGADDWTAFLCATTKGVSKSACAAVPKSFDPSDLNTPSVAIGRLAGTQTVTRSVTNVGRAKATYTPSVSGLPGVSVKVTPKRLTLRPGQTGSFTVKFTRATAAMNAYVSGQLTWSDTKHKVRIPLVVRPVAEAWTADHGVAGVQDSGEQVVTDPAGKRVYVTGVNYGSVPGQYNLSIATVAYDPKTGKELWSVGYAGPAGTYAEPHDTTVSPDGRTLYVTGGTAADDTGNDAVTIAYDTATGRKRWESRYTGPDAFTAWSNAVVVSRDGKHVYVTGMTTLAEGGIDDFFTASYDAATGKQAWATRYDGPGKATDDARMIALAPDGKTVFVGGQSPGLEETGYDWGTVAYDTATGKQKWVARYDGSAHGYDMPSAMTVTADGRSVIVTGASSDKSVDLTTVAYDTRTGAVRWTDSYDGPGQATDNPYVITVSRGRVYVTGNTEGDGTRFDLTTVAYDEASGRRLWIQRFDGKAHYDDTSWGLAVTPDGKKVVVTGTSADSDAGTDYVTIAYDSATGRQTWLGRYEGLVGASDSAHALAMTATKDGVRMFVTGQSTTAGSFDTGVEVDMTTVAYFDPWQR